jgi:hypothetical protein
MSRAARSIAGSAPSTSPVPAIDTPTALVDQGPCCSESESVGRSSDQDACHVAHSRRRTRRTTAGVSAANVTGRRRQFGGPTSSSAMPALSIAAAAGALQYAALADVNVVDRYDLIIELAIAWLPDLHWPPTVVKSRRAFVYQPCTSTAVNNGEPRVLTATRKSIVSRANPHPPGTAEFFGPGLITRRSQVQILPPPPKKALVDHKICQGFFRCRRAESARMYQACTRLLTASERSPW